MAKGCFCHFNGYEVKDAKARIQNVIRVSSPDDIDTTLSNVVWKFDCKNFTFVKTIAFNNVENVRLEGNNSTIDCNQAAPFNVFEFANCKNIDVCDFVYKPQNSKGLELYKGALVYFTGSENIQVYNNVGYDCTYLICLKTGNKYGDIRGNYVYIDHPGEWENPTAFSGIISYASSYMNIHDNQLYGNMRDGNLSIFGGGTSYNKVYSNIIDDTYNKIWDSQGITIDQGPNNCDVFDNTIIGCYYGIDIKAGTFNTHCYNNTITGCKVGIADRRGESENANATSGTVIENNMVIIEGFELLKSAGLLNGYSVYGIMSELRYGCKIKNNTIKYKNTTPIVVCGICLNGTTVEQTAYRDINLISGNDISFEYAFESVIYSPELGSVCVLLKNIAQITVKGNTFRCGNTKSYSCVYCDDVYGVSVVDNLLKAFLRNVMLVGGAEPTNCVITGNFTTDTKPFTDNVKPSLFNPAFTKSNLTIGVNYGYYY